MALRLYGDGNIENVTSINSAVSSTELGYLDGIGGIGKVLQVTQGERTTQFGTNSTTFVDVGLSASITPSSSSSNILVMVALGAVGNNGANYGTWINLVRGSTNIAQPTDGTNKQTLISYDNNAATGMPVSFNYLDSPATTSPITYKIQMRSNDATAYAMLNRIALNTSWSAVSTIILMEIAA